LAAAALTALLPAMPPASSAADPAADARLIAASDLAVSQVWSRDPATLRAGDSAVRTVIIEARGVTALRDTIVYFPFSAGISVRANPPEADTEQRGDGLALRAVHRFHVRIDTTRPIEFGQIYVPWYSTVRREQRLASLGRLFITPGQRGDVELQTELAERGAWWWRLEALLPDARLALTLAAALLVAGLLVTAGRDRLMALPGRLRRRHLRWRAARQLRTAARRGSADAFYRAARRWVALRDGADHAQSLRRAFIAAGLSGADCRALEAATYAQGAAPDLPRLAQRLLRAETARRSQR